MKTIALAIEHFSRFAGGAESYAVSLAESLVREGWEVHLFGESWDGEPEGATFHRISVPRWLPGWAKMFCFALEHRRLVTSRSFDVVMGFGNTIHMNVYQSHGGVHWCSTMRKLHAEPNTLVRLLNKLIVLTSPKHWTRHWIESAPFRMTPRPRIIAISQMIKDDMVAAYGIDGRDIELIYNGVDTDRFKPTLRERLRGPFRQVLGIGSEEVVFLFASYELKKKGIVPLVEAAGILKRLVDGGFRVVVAGAEPYAGLSKRAAQLGLKDTVIFVGRIRNMEECFANSDVLVLPTYYDACSLVVFEAMAAGLPCITTQFNGAAGIITEGVDGFILDHPPEPDALANKMGLLLDPARRRSMGQSASITAQKYTIRHNHREILKILNSVAQPGSRDGRDPILTTLFHVPGGSAEPIKSPLAPLWQRGDGEIFRTEATENAEDNHPLPSAVSAISAVKNKSPEPCVLCRSERRERLMEKDGWQVFKCCDCGLGFLNPRPSLAELTQLYDQEYFETQCLEGGALGSESFKRRLRLEDWRLRLFRRYKQRGKVLDVGCGYGYFLAACREKGYQVHGIDCSGFAVRHAMEKLRLDVTIGALDEIDMPAQEFDVVTFWHCLEHMQNPREALDKAIAWLKPDGVLIIEVPNHEGTDARRIGADWIGWSLPYHLYHFTPGSLRLLLKQQGFEIIKSLDFHSETIKESLKRIPVISFLARTIATFYSGHSIAVVARRASKE